MRELFEFVSAHLPKEPERLAETEALVRALAADARTARTGADRAQAEDAMVAMFEAVQPELSMEELQAVTLCLIGQRIAEIDFASLMMPLVYNERRAAPASAAVEG